MADTKQQEDVSTWFFKKALKENKAWSTLDEFMNDSGGRYFKEVCSIYPKLKDYGKEPKNSTQVKNYQFAELWLRTYLEQQKIMLQKFGRAEWRPFEEFVRDGNFMQYICKAVSAVYGIPVTQKDTWDPADMWCIRHQSKAKKMIEEVIGKPGEWGRKTPPGGGDIEELNSVLRTLYNNGKRNDKSDPAIVGISLKKVTTKKVLDKETNRRIEIPVAHFEEVNLSSRKFKSEEFRKGYGIKQLTIDCTLKEDLKGFQAKGATVLVLNTFHKHPIEYRFDLPILGSNGKPGKIKFEPSQVGTSARLGQTPTDMVPTVFNDRGLEWENNPSTVPNDLDSWMSSKSKYKSMWSKLRTAGQSGVFRGILNVERMGRSAVEFDRVMQHMFTPSNKKSPFGIKGEGDRVAATGKLKQLELFCACLDLAETKGGMTKLNQAWTDLTFFAQKKKRTSNDKFGPFGKIY